MFFLTSSSQVVDEELLTPITEPEDVPVAVHGTYVRCWDSIKRQVNHLFCDVILGVDFRNCRDFLE